MKSLRNITASPIEIIDTGVTIDASATYIIVPVDFPLWAASVNIDTYINNGNIVVNDGSGDLKPTAALLHIHDEGINRTSTYWSTLSNQNTSASTLTLTVTSSIIWEFEGTVAGQIVKLPNATTLINTHRFDIHNSSTQSVAIQDASSGTIFTIAAGQRLFATLMNNSTVAGHWHLDAFFLNGTGGGNAPIGFGFDGNASTGRWLESLTNIASNTTGYVVPGPGIRSIKALSFACSTNSTITVTLYKNGVSFETISLSASRKNTKFNLNHTLVNLDEISAQVTSGSCARPVVLLWL